MAAANPGVHCADGRECSGKAPLFAKILPRAAGNKKITVVDMVSTTVTDLANLPLVDTMHRALQTWCIILWVLA